MQRPAGGSKGSSFSYGLNFVISNYDYCYSNFRCFGIDISSSS